jgi:hypothetical protein
MDQQASFTRVAVALALLVQVACADRTHEYVAEIPVEELCEGFCAIQSRCGVLDDSAEACRSTCEGLSVFERCGAAMEEHLTCVNAMTCEEFEHYQNPEETSPHACQEEVQASSQCPAE